jgi:hypothetical protein
MPRARISSAAAPSADVAGRAGARDDQGAGARDPTMFPTTLIALGTGLSTLFDPRPGREHRPPTLPCAPDPATDGAVARVARSVLQEAEAQADPIERERLALAADVMRMLADEDWCLGAAQRRRALALVDALRRTTARADGFPVTGLLEAALDVDDGLAALHGELADWRDFHAFRASLAARLGVAVEHCHPSRQRWLAERAQACARVRRARERSRAARPSNPFGAA